MRSTRFSAVLCIGLLLCITTSADAQYTADISGRVVTNDSSIATGAWVSYYNPVMDTTYTAMVDENGDYEFIGMALSASRNVQSTPVMELQASLTNPVGGSTGYYVVSEEPLRQARVFNILGRQVTVLPLQSTPLGGKRWLSTGHWDGRSGGGRPVSDGRYFFVAGSAPVQPFLHLSQGGPASPQIRPVLESPLSSQEPGKTNQPQRRLMESVEFTVSLSPDTAGEQFEPMEFERTIVDGINGPFSDTVFALPPVRILFLGNSFTASHGGIYTHLEAMLNETHPSWPTYMDMIAPGGYTLQQHSQNQNTIWALTFGHWDMVFLQEQSYRPVAQPNLMYAAARNLDDFIQIGGGETGFFMTWAYADQPGMIDPLAAAYDSIGNELDAMVAPAGRAWQRSQQENPELTLHSQDGSHPNAHGVYLNACVFYAMLYGETPEGIAYVVDDSITDEQRRFLQQVAWNTVQDYRREMVDTHDEKPSGLK